MKNMQVLIESSYRPKLELMLPSEADLFNSFHQEIMSVEQMIMCTNAEIIHN